MSWRVLLYRCRDQGRGRGGVLQSYPIFSNMQSDDEASLQSDASQSQVHPPLHSCPPNYRQACMLYTSWQLIRQHVLPFMTWHQLGLTATANSTASPWEQLKCVCLLGLVVCHFLSAHRSPQTLNNSPANNPQTKVIYKTSNKAREQEVSSKPVSCCVCYS